MPSKRKPISKKTRFEVFKRDGFTCAYCGRTPPGVILEVDHIEPVSTGGSNVFSNLITACMDCNRGKSNNSLSNKKTKVGLNLKTEAADQDRSFKEWLAHRTEVNDLKMECIEKIFKSYYPSSSFTETFKINTLLQFLKELGFENTEYAMMVAIRKVRTPEDCIKYFCGICWRKIKGETRWPWPSEVAGDV